MNNIVEYSVGESEYTISLIDILHLQSVCNRGREKAIRLIETSRNVDDLVNFTFQYIKQLTKLENDLWDWRNKYNYYEGMPDNKSVEERMRKIFLLFEERIQYFTS